MFQTGHFIIQCLILIGFIFSTAEGDCPDSCLNKLCYTSGLCVHCKDGFYSILCNRACPPNCVNGACFRYNVSCSKGCKRGWYGEKCIKRCDSSCAGGCDRMSGKCFDIFPVTSTENIACERCFEGRCKRMQNGYECQGCKPGYTGRLCTNTCPPNCKTCTQNGNCTDCEVGYYGNTCDKMCNNCNGECSKLDGKCAHGCKEGYFDPRCTERCSGNCAITTSTLPLCDQTDGSCIDGCKSSYYGKFCNNTCHTSCSLAAQYKSTTSTANDNDNYNYYDNGDDYPAREKSSFFKHMTKWTWFIILSLVLVGLLIIIICCVLNHKRSRIRRRTRRRRRSSRRSRCRCRRCTETDVHHRDPASIQPIPCHIRRNEMSREPVIFVNSSQSNRCASWLRNDHHRPRDTSEDEHVYEEVGPGITSV